MSSGILEVMLFLTRSRGIEKCINAKNLKTLRTYLSEKEILKIIIYSRLNKIEICFHNLAKLKSVLWTRLS